MYYLIFLQRDIGRCIMNIKRVVKNILIKIKWGGVKRKFYSISDISGLSYSGTVVCPEKISIGADFAIARGFVLHVFPNSNIVGPQLCIGEHFWARNNLSIMCAESIKIGNNVTLARDIFVTDLNHGTSPLTDNYRKNKLETKPVTIDDGCWIGEKVCILSGVHIGKKVIIGAGSVVTKDIPDYSIAAGNPCKVIKVWNFEKEKWERVDDGKKI